MLKRVSYNKKANNLSQLRHEQCLSVYFVVEL